MTEPLTLDFAPSHHYDGNESRAAAAKVRLPGVPRVRMPSVAALASAERRFWQKVEKSAGCWIWTAGTQPNGYGVLSMGSDGTKMLAHRFAYELLVGPIPEGLVIDHLCRVRNCVNPEHLEPVTNAENIRRGDGATVRARFQRSKTHCPDGHPYSGENLYVRPNGRRLCRACWAKRNAVASARRSAERQARRREASK